jgi:uncharacterized protein with HEPN domain
MARDPCACLSDALQAAKAITEFCDKRSFDDFCSDKLLQSAVERQFMIIGEAFAQLARLDIALAEQIPDCRRIIAFRNILVHGYAIVDHEQVWSAVTTHLPPLRDAINALIAED